LFKVFVFLLALFTLLYFHVLAVQCKKFTICPSPTVAQYNQRDLPEFSEILLKKISLLMKRAIFINLPGGCILPF